MTHVLVPLVVVLPLLGGALALVTGRFPRLQFLLSTGTLALVTIVSIVLLVMVDSDCTAVIEVGAWPAPLGIVLMVDRHSAIMLEISSVVLLAVLLYAIGQGIADGDR
ncbi:MAG: Na+/H+ antiporter subunit D, partial [Demequina sp.]